MKTKNIRYAGTILALVALSLLRALATYVFVVPNGFAPGGLGGLASIIYNAILPKNPTLAQTWFNPAVTIFVLNLPLLILAFKKVDKQFAIYTTIGVFLYAGFMGLFSLVGFPQFAASSAESSNMIIAALVGGVMSGVSLGCMLHLNMSVGGTDIIGKAVYRINPVVNVSWLIFLSDCVIVILSGVLGFISAEKSDTASQIFVKVMTPIFYSFITLYVTSKVADLVGSGVESSVVFNVITEKYDEIGSEIVKQFGRGVTISTAIGQYTQEERHVLVCVVRKKQLIAIKKIIKEIDPQSFMFITTAKEVTGNGFHHTDGF